MNINVEHNCESHKPPDRNLFKNVILHDGSALNTWALSHYPLHFTKVLLDKLNCSLEDIKKQKLKNKKMNIEKKLKNNGNKGGATEGWMEKIYPEKNLTNQVGGSWSSQANSIVKKKSVSVNSEIKEIVTKKRSILKQNTVTSPTEIRKYRKNFIFDGEDSRKINLKRDTLQEVNKRRQKRSKGRQEAAQEDEKRSTTEKYDSANYLQCLKALDPFILASNAPSPFRYLTSFGPTIDHKSVLPFNVETLFDRVSG